MNYSDSEDSEDDLNLKSSIQHVSKPVVVQKEMKKKTNTLTKSSKKPLSLSFLPHAIQMALTKGVSAADSDSESDGDDMNDASVNVSSRREGKVRTDKGGSCVPQNTLLAALPKPMSVSYDNSISNQAHSSSSSSSSRWVLPNATSSWTSTTTAGKSSKRHVHSPHGDQKISTVTTTGIVVCQVVDEDEALFTFNAPGVRHSSALAGCSSDPQQMSMPQPLAMDLSGSGVAAVANGPETGSMRPTLISDEDDATSFVHSRATNSASFSDTHHALHSGDGEGGRLNKRKRERELEQLIQSGDLSALQALGDQVSEATAPTEWDRESYSQKQQAVAKVRRDFNSTAADVSSMEKNLTLSHKRNHQITSLAVQAVAVQLKNLDGTSRNK